MSHDIQRKRLFTPDYANYGTRVNTKLAILTSSLRSYWLSHLTIVYSSQFIMIRHYVSIVCEIDECRLPSGPVEAAHLRPTPNYSHVTLQGSQRALRSLSTAAFPTGPSVTGWRKAYFRHRARHEPLGSEGRRPASRWAQRLDYARSRERSL